MLSVSIGRRTVVGRAGPTTIVGQGHCSAADDVGVAAVGGLLRMIGSAPVAMAVIVRLRTDSGLGRPSDLPEAPGTTPGARCRASLGS